MKIMDRRTLLYASAIALNFGIAGCLTSENDSQSTSPAEGAQSGSGANLNITKSVLSKYQSHQRALNSGYQKSGTCVDGLGTPFVNPEITDVSYDEPRVLYYERTDGGEYNLVGVEWFVPAESTDSPPELFAGEDRRTFDGPTDGHFPGQPRHYGLHAWLFSENPNGTFATFNPTVRC
ncbi:MAG: hypothetical protein ABEJ42_06935 [Halobacteriaceae archaeon]